MTRLRTRRTLRWSILLLGLVLALALAAKLVGHVPGLKGTPADAIARDVYDYLKDMALVFITVIAAYLANVFQKRSAFVSSLEAQWRDIVHAKSQLVTYFEKPYPSTDDWLAAYARLSEAIDTMRIVYRNAGETDMLVGLYPYAPLHDMRRVLEAMDPRTRTTITAPERKLAKEAVLQAFFGLRECFLDELDLEEPSHPLLISGGRRLKQAGKTPAAAARQARQREQQARHASPAPEIDAYLGRLYAQEQSGTPSLTPAATLPAGKPAQPNGNPSPPQARGRD